MAEPGVSMTAAGPASHVDLAPLLAQLEEERALSEVRPRGEPTGGEERGWDAD